MIASLNALLLDERRFILWRHDLMLGHKEMPRDIDQQVGLFKRLEVVFSGHLLHCLFECVSLMDPYSIGWAKSLTLAATLDIFSE